VLCRLFQMIDFQEVDFPCLFPMVDFPKADRLGASWSYEETTTWDKLVGKKSKGINQWFTDKLDNMTPNDLIFTKILKFFKWYLIFFPFNEALIMSLFAHRAFEPVVHSSFSTQLGMGLIPFPPHILMCVCYSRISDLDNNLNIYIYICRCCTSL
jgi:hypothetical protein